MFSSHIRTVVLVLALLFSAAMFGSVADASHSWGTYHWARAANPFTLQLGDNVSTTWDAYLGAASTDWSVSSVLDTAVVSGANLKNCKPVGGRVEVCNRTYGKNGWLGVAQIWISGSHIVQGTVRVNDTYFNTTAYNTPAWRQFVMCQEIGHTFGLAHQDEKFGNANLGSCMDYTNDPTTNQHPNDHDYTQLETIYSSHLDMMTTALSKAAGASARANNNDIDTTDQKDWGKEVRKSKDGKSSLHERDLGKGQKLFTFVIWAE